LKYKPRYVERGKAPYRRPPRAREANKTASSLDTLATGDGIEEHTRIVKVGLEAYRVE
jgi:hypothetical protein